MDDTKQYTIQVKGKAYKFTPIPDSDIEKIMMLMNMNASPFKIVKGLTYVLKDSSGEDQWDEITDRMITGELGIRDITVEIFDKLVKRQRKDQPAPADDAE